MENYDAHKEELSKILKSLADKDPFWAWDKKYFPQSKDYLKRLKKLTKILYKENRKILHDALHELTKSSAFNYFKFWEDCLKWPKAVPVIHLKNKMPNRLFHFSHVEAKFNTNAENKMTFVAATFRLRSLTRAEARGYVILVTRCRHNMREMEKPITKFLLPKMQ